MKKIKIHLIHTAIVLALVSAVVVLGVSIVGGVRYFVSQKPTVQVPLHVRHHNIRRDYTLKFLDFCKTENVLSRIETNINLYIEKGNFKKAQESLKYHDLVSRGKLSYNDCVAYKLGYKVL